MPLLESRTGAIAPTTSRSDRMFLSQPEPVYPRFGSGEALHPPLVLVVDDHEDSRTIVRIVLESAGFRVAEAATGLEAVRVALDIQPAVILLDMVLPQLDGWETARLLRIDDSTSGAVIIAVTALASHSDQQRARTAGCDDVLTKPVSPATILGTIRRYVGLPPVTSRVS